MIAWPWFGEYAGRDGQIREQIRDLCEVGAPIATIQPFLYSYIASTAPNAHCLPIVCSKQVHKNYEEIVGRMPYKKQLIDKVRRKSKCNRLNRKLSRVRKRRKMTRRGGRVQRTRKRRF